MALELQPVTKTKVSRTTSSRSEKRWIKVFNSLAGIQDGDEAEIGLTSGSKGAIDLKKLKEYLQSESSKKLAEDTGLPKHQLVYLVGILEKKIDVNKDGKVTRKEWEQWISAHSKPKLNPKNKTLGGVVQTVFYQPSPTFQWCPPPVFIITISCIEILLYLLCVYAPETMGVKYSKTEGNWLICSPLIYDPKQRREAWRFITYMFLHGSNEHLIFNMLIQLFVGIPLEMSQPGWLGSLRVAALYMAGVILGCLGATCVEPTKYLLGASAGVYALILAHLATLILNWNEDGKIYKERLQEKEDAPPPLNLNPWIRGFRLAFVLLFVAFDVGMIIYNKAQGKGTTTSNAGHAFGAIAGCLIGVFVLKNKVVEDWELIFQWIALGVFGLLSSIFMIWHIAGNTWFKDECWNDDCIDKRCLVP